MGDRWDTGRLEAFSDGVFAIAITLLVLELNVPALEFRDLWHGIAEQWPSYLAYVTSFITIGALWMAHHGIFRRLAVADATVMRLNLLLLMFVSFLPFPTKLLAEALDRTAAERAAVIFYGLVLLAISVVMNALWRHAAGTRELLREEVSDREVAVITQMTAPGLGFYAGVVVLALVLPQAAAVGYLVFAVVAVMRTRGDPRGQQARGTG
jgi:uncharacterized membrane protein